jgi:SAM-dependent methyltransferase
MKIDLGCGPNPKEGFTGVDTIKFNDNIVVCNLGEERWPFEDGSIEEAHASHMIEHLTQEQRVHFCNELARVLQKGGKCTIIAPHWGAARAYGDPTHKWPAISEWFFLYLNQEWRLANAPHADIKWNPKGYACDFDWSYGYSFHQAATVGRNQEFIQFAVQFYKEACQDIVATITKR